MCAEGIASRFAVKMKMLHPAMATYDSIHEPTRLTGPVNYPGGR